MRPTPEITITAGWSGDALYSLEDVNRLYRGVERNTTVPHDFILYAGPEAQKPGRLNGLEAGIRIVESEYPSWWVGMKAFEPGQSGIKTASFFGLGLDCVVVGNLDDLLNFPSDLAAMKDYPAHDCPPGKENDCSMEVALFRNGMQKPLWEQYVREGKPQWCMTAKPAAGKLPLQFQGWINETKALRVDLFPENWVASYKLTVWEHGLPADCRIVSFHGRPKPGEVDEPWLQEHWR